MFRGGAYATLCSPDFLYESWLRVESKKGCSGVDGQEIREFGTGLEKNLLRISRELEEERYEPAPLRAVDIPKDAPGEYRRLGIPTVRDRVVFRGANILLQKLVDAQLSDTSFGYRNGRNIGDAVDAVAKLVRRGKTWFVRGDIRGCFDILDWEILSVTMRKFLSDQRLLRLLNKAIRVPVVRAGRILARNRGIPQGSPISPILANLYLHSFDSAMFRYGYSVIRYGDDWLILLESGEEALRCFENAVDALSRLKIDINREKSGIGDLRRAEIIFLGHRIGANRIEAGPNAWEWLSRALRDYKTSGDERIRRRAKGELINIQSAYRKSGEIARLARDAVESEW